LRPKTRVTLGAGAHDRVSGLVHHPYLLLAKSVLLFCINVGSVEGRARVAKKILKGPSLQESGGSEGAGPRRAGLTSP